MNQRNHIGFSNLMIAHPIDPESRRLPLLAAVSLVLVMVAVLLAAGCVSQGSDNLTQKSPEGKFIILLNHINENRTTISGHCYYGNPSSYCGNSPFFLNEKNGILTFHDFYRHEQINDSLIIFYGTDYNYNITMISCGNTDGRFAYSLPVQVSHNVTFDSTSDDGTVSLHYNNTSVVLKPKEHWNITHNTQFYNYYHHFTDDNLPECIEEITTTESIYNAGVFDKKNIIFQK
jgi:hypothetical protein